MSGARLGAAGVKGYAAKAGLPVEQFAATRLPPGLTPEIAGAEIRRLLSDETLAEELLRRWETEWSHDFAPLYQEYSY